MTSQTVSYSGAPAGRSVAVTSDGAVRLWLWATIVLIFVMVCVGGATRLTESGLSITQWKPLTGVLPPLSEQAWQAEFDLYKQIPQYAHLNADMTLAGFKAIYAWEWAHRLLARIVGAAFVLPALWFRARGRLRGALGRRVAVATGFLALEPVVGWWMVSSGLSERVEVSQDRLALHLLIAAAAFAALIAAAVGMSEPRREPIPASGKFAAGALVGWIFAQLGLGALVAGLRGGLLFNTWPKMDGAWIPDSAFATTPWARAILDDAGTAQFDHRLLAYLLALAAAAHAVAAARAAPGSRFVRRAVIVAVLVVAQAALGVATVLFAAPIGLALPHQALAMAVFAFAVVHWRASLRDGVRAP